MRLLKAFIRVIHLLLYGNERKDEMEEWNDQRIVDEARREWEMAANLFEEVTDPELVDYAVYNLRAAEKKYIYHLNRLRTLPPRASSGQF